MLDPTTSRLYFIPKARAIIGATRGVFLTCNVCAVSFGVVGAGNVLNETTAPEIAAVYRFNGWSGNGDMMHKARCPKCNTITASLQVTRADGVRFVYDKFSPNGAEINFLTAHNDFCASVPVGKFATAMDALQAIETFVMPLHI